MIHYSIIITHNNTPDLLQRCLDSIPQREDVEVIVIDDCKGACHARNVGIERSSGKWLLFADAGDYYAPGFLEALDVYQSLDVSVVCFSVRNIVCQWTTNRMPKGDRARLSFTSLEPWGKMFDREYIVSNRFRFEEMEMGNDRLFVAKACYYAPILLIDDVVVYVYEFRENRFSSFQSKEQKQSRFELLMSFNRFAILVGAKQYRQNISILQLYREEGASIVWRYLMLIAKYKQVGWHISCLAGSLRTRLDLALFGKEVNRSFICNHDKKLVYLNNSKVACSSIKASMFRDFDDYNEVHRFVNDHYSEYSLTPQIKRYYKFTFVRHPYKRLISCYENKVVQETDYFKLRDPSIRLWEVSDFDEFIRRIVLIPDVDDDPHFQSQYHLIHNRWGKCLVDYVGRFENIKEEYELIRQRFDLNPLPHKNKVASAMGKNWMDYYTLETAELVYAKYKKDFTHFGYVDEYKKLKAYLIEKEK